MKCRTENFVATYKPGSTPAEKYEKQRVLNTHLLPVFGDKTIAQIRQVDLDEYASDELERISQMTGRPVSVKTVNNQLAVLSTLIKYVTGQRSLLAIAAVYGDVAMPVTRALLPWPAGGQQKPSEQ